MTGRKGVGQVADAAFALAQQVHDLEPGRVRKGVEGAGDLGKH